MAKTSKKAKPAPRVGAKAKAAPVRERAARSRTVTRPLGGSRGKLERVRMPTPAKAARTEADVATDPSEGKYVYCIIKSEKALSFGALGIGTEPSLVQTVNYRDLAAVVSGTTLVVQDPTRLEGHELE